MATPRPGVYGLVVNVSAGGDPPPSAAGPVTPGDAPGDAAYRDLVDSAPDIIYRTDRHGRITFLNPATVRLTGREDLLGRTFLEVVRPDRRAEVLGFYRRQVLQGDLESYLEFPVLDVA